MRKPLLITATAAVAAACLAAGAAVAFGDTSAPSDESQVDSELLERTLDELAATGDVSVIAEVQDGDETWSSARGNHKLGDGDATEATDESRVGSVTKSMVTVVAMQLVDSGDLDLDASIQDLMPDLLPYDEPITVRQLLSHTSGVPDYFLDVFPSVVDGSPADIATNRENEYTPQELVGLAGDHPLNFTPGSQYSYSNTNYFVIGLLLEQLTGESVESLLADRVWDAVGMDDTYWPQGNELDGRHPNGYLASGDPDDPYIDTSAWSPTQLWAAGLTVSTGGDLDAFFRALFSGELVSADRLAEMREFTDVSDASYGLGLQAVPAECDQIPGGVAMGHTGGTFGHQTFSFHSPDGERNTTIMYNIDPQFDQAQSDKLNKAINDLAVAGLCNIDPSDPGVASTGVDITSVLEPTW